MFNHMENHTHNRPTSVCLPRLTSISGNFPVGVACVAMPRVHDEIAVHVVGEMTPAVRMAVPTCRAGAVDTRGRRAFRERERERERNAMVTCCGFEHQKSDGLC